MATNLYPFREAHLERLNNLCARDALDILRRHHVLCITTGQWEEPKGVKRPPPLTLELDALWNDFHSGFQTSVPDSEEDLASVLARAIHSATGELPDGLHVDCPRRMGPTWNWRRTNPTTRLTACLWRSVTRVPEVVP